MDKLKCRLYRVNKKTNKRTDGRKPCHDMSSAGFQTKQKLYAPNLLIRVLCCSVVECLRHNLGALDSNHTGSSTFFMGMSLGKTLQSPSLVLVKPRKDMNNVSRQHDMTEIMLKVT